MFILVLIPILFGVVNHDALNTFHNEMQEGAEWNYVGEQDVDPNAKSIDINGKIYYKLKWKDK